MRKERAEPKMIFLLYVIAGYWAAGRTIYANKIMIGSWSAIAIQKMTVGVLLGFILIPIALIKTIFFR